MTWKRNTGSLVFPFPFLHVSSFNGASISSIGLSKLQSLSLRVCGKNVDKLLVYIRTHIYILFTMLYQLSSLKYFFACIFILSPYIAILLCPIIFYINKM